MKILITGCRGQLGRELIRAEWPRGAELLSYDHQSFDIGMSGAANAILRQVGPDLVVNAAAYTAVDRAQAEPAVAFAVNARGPQYLAEACVRCNVPLIHISTDYVFDGSKKGAYVENDLTAPINTYGQSKNDGEIAIRSALRRHLIFRTSWVYSAFGNNFVKTMIRLGQSKKELRVVSDQVGSPTSAMDLASCIARISGHAISGEAIYGTYHVTNSGVTSWFGLAQAIFADFEKRTGRHVEVIPISTNEFPAAARRPANSCLDGSWFESNFGFSLPPWQDALDKVLNELGGRA